MIGHLVEADAGIEVGVESLLNLGAVHIALCFEYVLAVLQECGIVFAGETEGACGINLSGHWSGGESHLNLGVFFHAEK